jgi:release factor glutamine methyltransferase
LPEAIVSVTDSSREALDAAKENAAMNGCDIEFICDDLLHPSRNYDKYDCIVSNPPYVRKSEKQFMHSNVLDFEPHGALFVEDADPLIFYRAIAEFSGKYLVPGGDIYLEINEYLGKETGELFERSGFRKVTISKDLQNKNRYLTAKK